MSSSDSTVALFLAVALVVTCRGAAPASASSTIGPMARVREGRATDEAVRECG
jgi:hypothetical protein